MNHNVCLCLLVNGGTVFPIFTSTEQSDIIFTPPEAPAVALPRVTLERKLFIRN